MNTQILQRQFEAIGANLEVERLQWSLNGHFQLDVDEKPGDEKFILRIGKGSLDKVEFQVPHKDKADRHLLLVSRNLETDKITKEKFLCGHDERHWFVAGLPAFAPRIGSIKNVTEAKEALKPPRAHFSQLARNVKRKDRNKRKNAGFIRQGEWFFVPADWVPGGVILFNEPLVRPGGGKPHVVEEMIRIGGELIYVHRANSRIMLRASEFESRKRRRKNFRTKDYVPMRANPRMFVRGKVRHADHATLKLRDWHEVNINGEPQTSFVAFLD